MAACVEVKEGCMFLMASLKFSLCASFKFDSIWEEVA